MSEVIIKLDHLTILTKAANAFQRSLELEVEETKAEDRNRLSVADLEATIREVRTTIEAVTAAVAEEQRNAADSQSFDIPPKLTRVTQYTLAAMMVQATALTMQLMTGAKVDATVNPAHMLKGARALVLDVRGFWNDPYPSLAAKFGRVHAHVQDALQHSAEVSARRALLTSERESKRITDVTGRPL